MLRTWQWAALAVAVLGIVLALAAPPPAAFETDIGTDSDTRVVRGVQAAEQNADGPFRWTDGDAEVRFTGFEQASSIVVALRATPPQRSTPTPLAVTFFADHLPPLHVAAQPSWRTYHFFIPRDTQGWTAPTVRLQAEPVQASDSDDRKVGLALSAVAASNGAGIAPVATLERALFLLTLLALVGMRRDIHRGTRHHVHAATAAERRARRRELDRANRDRLLVAATVERRRVRRSHPRRAAAGTVRITSTHRDALVDDRGRGSSIHRHSNAIVTIAHSAWLHAARRR